MAVRKLEERNTIIGIYAEFDAWLASRVSQYGKASNKPEFYVKLRKEVSDRQYALYNEIGTLLEEEFKENINAGILGAKPKSVTSWRVTDFGFAEMRAHKMLGNVSTDGFIMDRIYEIFDKSILNQGVGMTDKPTLFDKIKGMLFRDLSSAGLKKPELSGPFSKDHVLGTEKAKQAYYKRVSDDVNKKIHEAIGSDLSRALTLQRSFNNVAYRAGQIESWETNSDQVVGWMWKARLSDTTCPVCIFMHGSRHSLSQTLNSHRNCRCKMVPILGDDLGKIQASEVGEEWFTEQDEATQRKVLGPTRYNLWKNGDYSLEELIRAGKDPIFGATLGLTPLNLLQSTGKNAALERALISTIKDDFPNLVIDLNGIAQELRIPVLQILEDFSKKYPEAVGRLDGFVTVTSGLAKTKLSPAATAHVSAHAVDPDAMNPSKNFEFQAVFDDKRFESLERARVSAKRSYDEEWLASDHPLNTFHHELAHVAWNNLKYNFGEVYKDEIGMTINDYYQQWLTDNHLTIDHPSKYAKTSKDKAMSDNVRHAGSNRLLAYSHAEPEAENYSNVATAQLKLTSAKMHTHFLDEMHKMIREGIFKIRKTISLQPNHKEGRSLRAKIEKRLDWRQTK